jgi:diaminopimelate epimerase
MIPFLKMHGCGNDFVVLRHPDFTAAALPLAPPELARRVCDRHYGIGADGLLIYEVLGPERLRMHYWNADGSRAEMCGNGARCVIRAACEGDGLRSQLTLVTDAGEHRAECGPGRAALSMGTPRWDAAAIPARPPAGDAAWTVLSGGERWSVHAVGMGNPHAIVFVPDRDALQQVALATTGRALSEHAAFPAGANASFVAVENGALHLRVWERGAGATLACGTASCAALAVAVRTGRVASPRAAVHLPGGTVEVWQDVDGTLWLAGPAAIIATGTLHPELLAGGT